MVQRKKVVLLEQMPRTGRTMDQRVHMVAPSELVRRIDAWRWRVCAGMSRSAAWRRLATVGLDSMEQFERDVQQPNTNHEGDTLPKPLKG